MYECFLGDKTFDDMILIRMSTLIEITDNSTAFSSSSVLSLARYKCFLIGVRQLTGAQCF